MTKPINLLVVDDSKVMRDAIVSMFDAEPNVNVVAQAANGQECLDALEKYRPDVITLDVAMPVMDGITTLKHMMIENPCPTVMLSSLTLEGTRVAFDALRYGAVDFIAKPSTINDGDLSEQVAEIQSKIEFAAQVETSALKYIRDSGNVKPQNEHAHCSKVVAIGAGEGGYGALLKVIPHLKADAPVAYLVTMYADREHVDAFASYLNGWSGVHVKRAGHGEVIKPGYCYLSSGADYMSLHQQGEDFSLHVSPAPFASRKGAVDMLLFSVADLIGERCIGVVLSGLGEDGAEGLEEVVNMHGQAIVQDPKTCLCKDMAQAALEASGSQLVVADTELAEAINKLF